MFRILGKTASVQLNPDDLDQLLDALDSLDRPLRNWDLHTELRRRLSVAYDETQSA